MSTHWHIRFLAPSHESNVLLPYEAGLAYSEIEAMRLTERLSLDFCNAWLEAKNIKHGRVFTETLPKIAHNYYSIIVGEEEVFCEASACQRKPCPYLGEWNEEELDVEVWASVAAHHNLLEHLLS